ncbi:MAG: helix-turn-helix domain-containing protein [Candidatus Competibacter denitrificans]|jgi:excisionase family DNA binding protein
MMIQPDLLSYEQAGKRLGMSASTVRRLVKARKLSVVYPSERPKIKVTEIERYIEKISTPNVLHFDKPARPGKISRQQAADLLR